MNRESGFGRRQILAWGGALAGGGLGAIPGLEFASSGVFAADGALRRVVIANPQTDMNMTFVEMLESDGYLQGAGLESEVVSISDGGKILAALIGGSADICGGAGFSGIFPAIAHGAKVKLIGGALVASILGLSAKNPGIRTAKDLVGKTVGAGAPGAALHQQVVALLQKEGIDYRKVNFRNVGGSPDVLKAVVAGTVDAGPCELGHAAQFEKYGVHILEDGVFSDQLPLYTSQAFFTSDATIEKKRDVLVRALAAHGKLFRFLTSSQSKDAWLAASARVFGGADKAVQALPEWQFFQQPNRLDANLVLSEERIAYMQKLNVTLGEQKDILPFDQVADMSLASDALKMIG